MKITNWTDWDIEIHPVGEKSCDIVGRDMRGNKFYLARVSSKEQGEVWVSDMRRFVNSCIQLDRLQQKHPELFPEEI